MDHAILLGKLKLYGVSSQSLNWFQSYLSDRKPQTFIDGIQSDFSNITCGIPQGSILGPLLFTIYINDLPSCDFFSKPKLYADDATLTTSAEDPWVRSSVLLDELGLERLEHVRLKQLAVTMYKIHNNLSPSYLRRIFTNTSNVHSHNLRNSELNYYVPRPRTESAIGSLHYRGSVEANPQQENNFVFLSLFHSIFVIYTPSMLSERVSVSSCSKKETMCFVTR